MKVHACLCVHVCESLWCARVCVCVYVCMCVHACMGDCASLCLYSTSTCKLYRILVFFRKTGVQGDGVSGRPVGK